MSEDVDVSVLIPVLNEESHLLGAARAMLAQQLDGQAEFLFIDGGSEDGSLRILRELETADPRVRVLANPARRTPQALNIGLRAAGGEFVARMDAHTIYPPQYLASAIARLRKGGVDWVSGPQLPFGTDRGSRRVAKALSRPLGAGGADYRYSLGEEHEVDSGFTGVWRRATLEQHGGWDEEWLNDQDLELAARIRGAGGRIVCIPEMAARYVPRSTLRRLARQYLTYGTYRVKTAGRHPETLRRSQLIPPLVTLTAALALVAPSRGLRRLSRAGVAVYSSVMMLAAARGGEDAEVSDVVGLPMVWATMHFSYGLGFVRGSWTYGLPSAALRRVLLGQILRGESGEGRPSDACRIAVYTDYRYRRTGDRIYAERAFALFLVELSRHLEHMVIAGKVDPRPGESHYVLPAEIGFVELPYYESLTQPLQMTIAMARSLLGFWRLLSEVDGVWLLGPHPLAVVFAALAALRGRPVTLGVRQDFPCYVRARHPGERAIAIAGDILEKVWRAMARIAPVVTVGPELTARYPSGKRLEMTVSLVADEDIRPVDDPLPDYGGPELRALSVGRLEQEKNPLLLADVAVALIARDPRWRLTVCGEGPLADALAERLVELGVRDRVDLLGYVPHDRGLREIYRNSHVLLHVSWTEGLPQVLFEAFAARLPVVATAVGGVAAASGAAAVLIDPGDAEGAADAVADVSEDRELREQLVAAGVERVRAHTLDVEAARVAQFICRPGRR